MAKHKQKPFLAPTRPQAVPADEHEPSVAEVAKPPSTGRHKAATAMPDDVGPVVAGDEAEPAQAPAEEPSAPSEMPAAEPATVHECQRCEHPEQQCPCEYAPPPVAYVVIGGGAVKYGGKFYQPGQRIPIPADMAAALIDCVAVAGE